MQRANAVPVGATSDVTSAVLGKRDGSAFSHSNGTQLASFVAVLLFLFLVFPILGVYRRRRVILERDRLAALWEATRARQHAMQMSQMPRLWELYAAGETKGLLPAEWGRLAVSSSLCALRLCKQC
jgi:hypothetical protein